MLHHTDLSLSKLRFLAVGMFIIVSVCLLMIFVSVAAAVSAQTTDTGSSVSTYAAANNPNVVAGGFADAADAIGQRMSLTGDALSSSLHYQAVASAQSARSAAHFSAVVASGTGRGLLFTSRTIGTGAAFAIHVPAKIFDFISQSSPVSAILQPVDHTPTPTITQLRAQQATLIQSGTQEVSVAALTTGVGGACDAGNGNGGYPMSWCNAPMDTIQTVSYSSDHINRECTSYAYWYFSNIEGHTDFRVRGDAKYWAATSNYPTHTTPVVGAMAVETAGSYGHVAIVQALPGQSYAGQAVPAGYVLVSEMNYDWNGHFRYSYSPLSKFSAYIY